MYRQNNSVDPTKDSTAGTKVHKFYSMGLQITGLNTRQTKKELTILKS